MKRTKAAVSLVLAASMLGSMGTLVHADTYGRAYGGGCIYDWGIDNGYLVIDVDASGSAGTGNYTAFSSASEPFSNVRIMCSNLTGINPVWFGDLSGLNGRHIDTLYVGSGVRGISLLDYCSSLDYIDLKDSEGAYIDLYGTQMTSLPDISVWPEQPGGNEISFSAAPNLTNISVPSSYGVFDYVYFNGCPNLESAYLNYGIDRIGRAEFSECPSLNCVQMDNSVTSIEYRAFYNCDSLEEISLPESVSSINIAAFDNCDNLSDIYVNMTRSQWEENVYFYIEDEDIDNQDPTSPYYNPIDDDYDYEPIEMEPSDLHLGNSTVIHFTDDNLYSNFSCGKVTAIDPCYNQDGTVCINGQYYLWTYDAGSETVNIELVSQAEYDACGYPAGVPWNNTNNSISTVNIACEPECGLLTFEIVPVYGYSGSSLSSIRDISISGPVSSVKGLGQLGGLQTVDLSGVTAHWNCSLTFNGANLNSFPEIIRGQDVSVYVEYSDNTACEDVTVPQEYVEDYWFTMHNCTNLTDLTLESGITSVPGGSFSSNQSLDEVNIPDSVTSIEYFSFSNCTSLQSISIPSSVELIRPDSFNNCSALTDIWFDCTLDHFLNEMDVSYKSYWDTNWQEGDEIIISYDHAFRGIDATLHFNDGQTMSSRPLASELVDRLYELVMLRNPDREGSMHWTDELETHHMTGAAVVNAFLKSAECTARNLSDEQFVELLYRIFTGREPDAAGVSHFASQIAEGSMTRDDVVDAFVNSREWKERCEYYGILSGARSGSSDNTPTPTPESNTTTPTPAPQTTTAPTPGDNQPTPPVTPATTPATPTDAPESGSTVVPTPSSGGRRSADRSASGFVDRLYNVALGRESDPAGHDDWLDAITSGRTTGAEAARGFILSDEFINRNYTDEEFVDILYNTFFGRDADAAGKAAWLSVLANGTSREEILDGFINSTEWANICVTYGIISGGTGTPNIEVEPNEQTIEFVRRLYSICLERQADEAGLMAWARQLANQRDTGSGAARGFFFSAEFTGRNYSNSEYVTSLYRAILGREPDEAGLAAWTAQLDEGSASREEVFDGFACSPEFGRICADYGILR